MNDEMALLAFLLAVLPCLVHSNHQVAIPGSSFNVQVEANKSKLEILKSNSAVLTVTVLSIAEKDANGIDVPANNNVDPHSEMGLDEKKFETTGTMTNISGTTATSYAFQLTRNVELKSKKPTLRITYVVALGDGSIKGYNDSNVYQVTTGTVALSISVKNWPFCTASDVCKDSNNTNILGKYLDVKVKVAFEKGLTSVGADMYQATGDHASVKVTLSPDAAVIHGSDVMPQRLPPMLQGDTFTFRLPSFNNNEEVAYKYARTMVTAGATAKGPFSVLVLAAVFYLVVTFI